MLDVNLDKDFAFLAVQLERFAAVLAFLIVVDTESVT